MIDSTVYIQWLDKNLNNEFLFSHFKNKKFVTIPNNKVIEFCDKITKKIEVLKTPYTNFKIILIGLIFVTALFLQSQFKFLAILPVLFLIWCFRKKNIYAYNKQNHEHFLQKFKDFKAWMNSTDDVKNTFLDDYKAKRKMTIDIPEILDPATLQEQERLIGQQLRQKDNDPGLIKAQTQAAAEQFIINANTNRFVTVEKHNNDFVFSSVFDWFKAYQAYSEFITPVKS